MKKILFLSALIAFSFTACNDDEDNSPTETMIIDSSQPSGAFTANRSGTFVYQNAAGSVGTAELGTDANGAQFLHFTSSFSTNFNTGTVTIYLSTSNDDLTTQFDPGNGNPSLRIVAPVTSGGEKYFRINPAAGAEFDNVILWCASAAVPFGYAALN